MASRYRGSRAVDQKLGEVKEEYDAVLRARNRFRGQKTRLETTVTALASMLEDGTTARLTPEDLRGIPNKYRPLLEALLRQNRAVGRYRRGTAGSKQRILSNGETKIKQLESDRALKRRLVRSVTDEPTYQELLEWSMYGRGARAKETPATRFIANYVEREREVLSKLKEIDEEGASRRRRRRS